MTAVLDRIPKMHGHWKLDVYEGDVVRAPLTARQEAENAEWLAAALRTGSMPEGWHHGEVLNHQVECIEGDNLVVTTGKSLLLDRLFALGTPPSQLTHLGVGASATAAAVGDTQLNTTPTLQAYDALPTRASLVVTTLTTFATGTANINWQELGLFNGSVNGTSIMFNRIAPIGPFNKTSAVSIAVTVTITQS